MTKDAFYCSLKCIKKDYSLTIKFNFVNFFIKNKSLKYNYEKLFSDQLNDKGYEKKVTFCFK